MTERQIENRVKKLGEIETVTLHGIKAQILLTHVG